MSETGTADTFPRLLQWHARQRPDATAIREKDLGIWQSWTWAEALREVQQIAAGLHQAGFQRGEHLAIIGENRPRLYFTMIATQCLGGIPVPLYQDAVAAEMAFVFDNAEIRFAVAEDQEQVDKLLEVRETVPQLKHIIYEDPRGLRNYDQAGLASYEQIRALGEQLLKQRPSLIDDEIAKGRADDVAAMFYTSGTTGNPKGVVLDYANLLAAGRAGAAMEHLTEREEVLAYLPMAWIGQNIFSYTQWLVCGFTVNCPESAATVMADMREIGPTYYFAPPRVLEALLTQVMIRMEDASALKRQHVSPLHGRRAARRRTAARQAAGRCRRPAALCTRRLAGLRAAAQRARHEPHPRRLYRWRGDRAGSFYLLPLARHQPEAAVRLDRDLGVRLRAAQWRRQARHRRPAGQGRRNPADRCRRDPDSLAGAVPRVLQGARGHARSQGCRTAGFTPAMPATSTPKAT